METKHLNSRIQQLEADIRAHITACVTTFNADTGLYIRAVDIEMVPAKQVGFGRPVEFYIGAVSVTVAL